jgi:hypothetical protein
MISTVFLALTASALAACFGAPEPVTIEGWSKDAMEPFISRGGDLLFFNSSNAPGQKTDIYWARRIGPLRFRFQGPVTGANSPVLNGVASLSRDGAFALISPRAVEATHATIWIGHWMLDAVEGLAPQPALTPKGPGGFNMDAEISSDGQRLYLTDSRWNPRGPPKSAVLRLARKTPEGWRIDPAADRWFAGLGGGASLQYAASTSDDELELYFTRAEPAAGRAPQIWVATRPDAAAPFSQSARLLTLTGFVEGPSAAPDGSLYFHQQEGDRFVIMRTVRVCK